jgi:hypothetical protein
MHFDAPTRPRKVLEPFCNLLRFEALLIVSTAWGMCRERASIAHQKHPRSNRHHDEHGAAGFGGLQRQRARRLVVHDRIRFFDDRGHRPDRPGKRDPSTSFVIEEGPVNQKRADHA